MKRCDETGGVGRYFVFVLVLLALGAVPSAPPAQADKISCATVVHELDAIIGRRGKHRADPVRVAHRLGVDPAWVLHCAQLYGRRVSQKLPPIDDEAREAMQERWESEEPTEVEREDTVQGPLELPDNRPEMRLPAVPGIPGAEEEDDELEGGHPPP